MTLQKSEVQMESFGAYASANFFAFLRRFSSLTTNERQTSMDTNATSPAFGTISLDARSAPNVGESSASNWFE